MVSARDLRVAATVDTPRGVPKAGGKSNVGGDAGARAPNVVSARVTTKATVLLRRPAIILISCRCATADGQFTPEIWRKVPPTGRSKKNSRRIVTHRKEPPLSQHHHIQALLRHVDSPK